MFLTPQFGEWVYYLLSSYSSRETISIFWKKEEMNRKRCNIWPLTDIPTVTISSANTLEAHLTVNE